MTILDVIILSIIEGVTEFLPISSTAHLILTSHILGIPKTTFLSTFEVAIQVGAIFAVVVLYFNRLKSQTSLLYKAVIGFIPTGILGFLFYDHIKILLNDPFIPVASLFIGGVAIIGIEFFIKRQTANHPERSAQESSAYKLQTKNLTGLSYRNALLIGLIQSISMIPGVSRAAASIFGAMALKFDRKSAVEFSFLLAIPTMMAATIFDIKENLASFTQQQTIYLGLGIIFSFISATIVIKWLIRYVQTNNFVLFGIYRIALSILYFFLFLR